MPTATDLATTKMPATHVTEPKKTAREDVFLAAAYGFLARVQGTIEEDDRALGPHFRLSERFLNGTDTVMGKIWELLPQITGIVKKSQHGLSVQDEELFRRLSIQLAALFAYARGTDALKNFEVSATTTVDEHLENFVL